LTARGASVAADEGQALNGIIAAGLSGSFGVSRVPFASVE